MSAEVPRSFSQWAFLGSLPGLVCNGLAVLAWVLEPLGLVLLFAPIAILVYVVQLSSRYDTERLVAGLPRGRFGFIVGFGLLNLVLWGVSCMLALGGLAMGLH